jgi:multidrug efflux pump subunit AcrA (membrane-fusion protein)
VLLAAGVIGTGAGTVSFYVLAAEAADVKNDKPQPLVASDPDERTNQCRLPARYDGVILVIGTDIKPGEKVAPDRLITVKVGTEVKQYRRLKKGDTVEEGQLLARLDDRLPRSEVAIKVRKVEASKAEYDAAVKAREEFRQRLATQTKLRAGSPMATSLEDLRAVQLLYDRSLLDAVAKQQAVEVAQLELKQAQTVLEMYEIRSPVRGVVKSIRKHPGEAVRSLETVLIIQIAEEEK